MRRLKIYKEWVLNKVLRVHEKNTLAVMSLGEVKPNYRDVQPRLVTSTQLDRLLI